LINVEGMKWYEILDALANAGIWPSKLGRVLLYGPPGTGKTSWCIERLGRSNVERVVCHEAATADDLVGTWSLQSVGGASVTALVDGAGTRAMKRGVPCLLDEVDEHSAEQKPVLHAIADDHAVSSVTQPDGSTVTPSEGFAVVATMNGEPGDLPAALLDRFDLVLRCDVPAPGALARIDPAGLRAAVEEAYCQRAASSPPAWAPELSVRSGMAVSKLHAAGMTLGNAARLVFGVRGPEIESICGMAEERAAKRVEAEREAAERAERMVTVCCKACGEESEHDRDDADDEGEVLCPHCERWVNLELRAV